MERALPRKLSLALNAAMLAAGVALLVLAAAIRSAEAGAGAAPRGGTFRILILRGFFDSVDPAFAYLTASWSLLDTTCALLLRRPDLPPPAGYRPVPEVAAGYPTVSADGRIYSFTVRQGFRFSDGSRLTARNFAAAIGRLKNPALDSPGAQFVEEVVSARAVRADRLVIRLSKPTPDFTARLTIPFFCPVPLGLPSDPEGIGAPFSGAGPYFVASWARGGDLVARRNPFYRGERPQHVDGFRVREADTPDREAAIREVERDQADWFNGGGINIPIGSRDELIRKYGVNRSQYFVARAPVTWFLALNNERPLFRNNVRLRQAVGFAVDRAALLRIYAPRYGNATDQLLPTTMPGFRNAHIYPLKQPDVARAKALARGRTRGGKAVLYTFDTPQQRVLGEVIRANLRQIGIDVELKQFGFGVLFRRLGTRGEPFDMALEGWGPDYVDPSNFLQLLDGRSIRARENVNISYFNSSSYNRALDRAERLQGEARLRALGELDVRVVTDEAPIVPLYNTNEHVFVSKRVGCLVFNRFSAQLNLGTVCLKQ